MRDLYPDTDAYKTEFLDVGSGHKLYVEQSGNPLGQPVIVFHGGPGGMSKPKHRKFFNPDKFRVVLFDQRGCGKSEFTDLLQDNTTQNLLEDVEKIRKHLSIEKWHVFGGSWGSTMALAYAEKHPHLVKSMIVKGIFYGSKEEDQWLFGGGSQKFFPEKYQNLEKFMASQDLTVSGDNIAKLIFGEDEDLAFKTAKLAEDWEGAVYLFEPEDEPAEELDAEEKELMLNSKKIMFHYTQNSCFFEKDELLNNAHKLKDIPIAIVHGRYDLICPIESAWKLSQRLPHADFKIINADGHSASNPETITALIEYTDSFAEL